MHVSLEEKYAILSKPISSAVRSVSASSTPVNALPMRMEFLKPYYTCMSLLISLNCNNFFNTHHISEY